MPLDSTTYLDNDARVLLKAADLIEQRGWMQMQPLDGSYIKGLYWDADGNCIMNAIFKAQGDASGMDRLAKRMGFPHQMAAWDWNDEFGRKKEEVVARLRDAAWRKP